MKKSKIIGVFVSFVLTVMLHFIYEVFPNSFFSVIAPVNESIWEHMKLIATSSLMFGIIEYFVYKKKDMIFNNFWLSYGIAILFGIFVYLLIYIPLNDIFGHKAYIAIGLLSLILALVQYISYYIMNRYEIKHSNDLGILVIILIYLGFGYLTYHPPRINLFYDYMHHGFGIIKRMI